MHPFPPLKLTYPFSGCSYQEGPGGEVEILSQAFHVGIIGQQAGMGQGRKVNGPTVADFYQVGVAGEQAL